MRATTLVLAASLGVALAGCEDVPMTTAPAEA